LLHLRDAAAKPPRFRAAARRLGSLLAIEATRDLATSVVSVETPLGPAEGRQPPAPIVAVPVLRAGLGLLEGVVDAIPYVTVGMVGLERQEDSLTATRYYRKLPDLDGALVLVLEPMLATGGSASTAVNEVAEAPSVTVLSVVATEEAVARLTSVRPDVRVVTAAVDPDLDANGYIVPGLGDFGDRLYGTGHGSGLG
ncbi:MAG: uracil phosphoribosyltransferase, partial [Nitriliruptorales bacterium]|nr:uracil phosphoribosyltransferase [Nitriliruptorales bacterium]